MEALTSGIGAASEELQLQGFCVHRHQGNSRQFMFRPGIPTSASSARKPATPISLEASGMTAPVPWVPSTVLSCRVSALGM